MQALLPIVEDLKKIVEERREAKAEAEIKTPTPEKEED
jgi:hypothetical protein